MEAPAVIAEACLYVDFQRVEMSDHQLSCNAERAEPGRPWHALPVEQTRELIWGPLSNSISPPPNSLEKLMASLNLRLLWTGE